MNTGPSSLIPIAGMNAAIALMDVARTDGAAHEPECHPPEQLRGQHVYGDCRELGICIELHDFRLPQGTACVWHNASHPDLLELCLNLAGQGVVRSANGEAVLEAGSALFYAPGAGTLQAERRAGEAHRFLLLRFSRSFLQQHLRTGNAEMLLPAIAQFLADEANPAVLGEPRRLTAEQDQLVAQWLLPPVPQCARHLWCQGALLQLMAEFCFVRQEETELPCNRQKRVAQDRVQRVVTILRRDVAEPPTLEKIGREVGCSPFYLSRTFSRETGMTIPQYLRKLRLECAAELLKSGRCNVTEAAMEVGYSSLSHFSQAFCQAMGCCPALYTASQQAAEKPVCGNDCPSAKA